MSNARVLIADTDRRLRASLYKRLLDAGIFSDCVATANDAIECMRDRAYGLVLLDLELPDGAGYALIEQIRVLPRTERPMILATASRDLQPGVDPELVQIIIRKPLRLIDVAEMIRACVGSVGNSVARGAKGADRGGEIAGPDEHGVRIVS